MAKDQDTIAALQAKVAELEAAAHGGGESESLKAVRMIVDELRNGATPDRAMLSAEKQRELSTPHAKPTRWRTIQCMSTKTQSFFTAHIVESRDPKMPHGRIVTIGPWRLGVGRYKFTENGGLISKGFPILNGNDKSDPFAEPLVADEVEISKSLLSQEYLNWRTAQWVEDLREYVGKAFRPELCRHAKDIDTPWNEGAERAA